MRRHYAEVADWQDQCPFDPQWDQYVAMELAGHLRVLSARDPSHQLVGYTSTIVAPLLHSQRVLRARSDAFYVDPLFRHAGLGAAMFQRCEQDLRRQGVHRMEWIAKCARDGTVPADTLLRRLGYVPFEVAYGKML